MPVRHSKLMGWTIMGPAAAKKVSVVLLIFCKRRAIELGKGIEKEQQKET